MSVLLSIILFVLLLPNGWSKNRYGIIKCSINGETVEGYQWPNGKGFVAQSAHVALGVYIGPKAQVCGEASIRGNARIEDEALIMGHAEVNDATIRGRAVIRDNAIVDGDGVIVEGLAVVYEDARITGPIIKSKTLITDQAKIFGRAEVSLGATISEKARVSGQAYVQGRRTKVSAWAHVTGNAWVTGDDDEGPSIRGEARIDEYAWIKGSAEIYGRSVVKGKVKKSWHLPGTDRYRGAIVKDKAKVHGRAIITETAVIAGEQDIRSGHHQ